MWTTHLHEVVDVEIGDFWSEWLVKKSVQLNSNVHVFLKIREVVDRHNLSLYLSWLSYIDAGPTSEKQKPVARHTCGYLF